jgi:hypothetical protein
MGEVREGKTVLKRSGTSGQKKGIDQIRKEEEE